MIRNARHLRNPKPEKMVTRARAYDSARVEAMNISPFDRQTPLDIINNYLATSARLRIGKGLFPLNTPYQGNQDSSVWGFII